MEAQATMSKEYVLYGFCYYHYWFKNGKKLLEKPLERMMANPKVDIPFCLCWANENWTRRWDGGNNEVFVEQEYDDIQNLDNHVDYLCQFFADPRYIREDGKPLLLIYKPELIPDIRARVKHIRKRVRKNGFPGVKLFVQYPEFFFRHSIRRNIFDAYIQFQPLFQERQKFPSWGMRASLKTKLFIKKLLISLGLWEEINEMREPFRTQNIKTDPSSALLCNLKNYDSDWQTILAYRVKDKRLIAGAFVDWDNTPRNKTGTVYEGATPQKFEMYMRQLVRKVRDEYTKPYIFINAWNEWGEGAYLEPDQRHKYAYLEALRRALLEE